jgi:hypothetical protein
VLVATLEERGGEMVLSPPVAVSDRAARETALRVADRIMPSVPTPSEAAAV